MILVDTSVWIEFLRGRKSEKVTQLELSLDLGDVCINEVIFNEVCLGAKDKHQFQKYVKYFGEIPFYFLESWHEEVAEMRHTLKRTGHTTYLPDALIAYTAVRHNLPLMTIDKDFNIYSKVFGLQLL